MNSANITLLPEQYTARYRRLRRLYHFLTTHRLTIFVYGLSFYMPPTMILAFLAMLAIVLTPFMIRVLIEQHQHGWLIAFAVMIGVPIGVAFIPISIPSFHTALMFLPLLMFYLYCVLLRWAVADWISDASPEGELEVEAEDSLEDQRINSKWGRRW